MSFGRGNGRENENGRGGGKETWSDLGKKKKKKD